MSILKEILSGKIEQRDNIIPSKAIIWNNQRGEGVVIQYDGTNISEEIDAIGTVALNALGLDDAPPGFSIWEGKSVWSPGPYEHPMDGDVELIGKFRPLTDDEWLKLKDEEV